MSERVRPAERLLNLVIALMNTPGRMTKEEIRRGVRGYQGSTDDAFERMFERDKDALRDLAVPVLTVDAGGAASEIGYRIDPDSYTLAPLEFTAAEFGVLALAAGFWQDAVLRTEATRALAKLRVVAEGTQDDVVAGLLPRAQPAGEYLPVLLDAILDRRVVEFTYRSAHSGEVNERRVEPWRVLSHGNGWYLVGNDLDRGASRSFRLSRVLSEVRPVGEGKAFAPPEPGAAQTVFDEPPRSPDQLATLAVAPERAGTLRARAVDPAGDPPTRRAGLEDRDVIQVPYADRWMLASEVAGYGPAVLVLDPPDLRDDVVARLEAAAAFATAGGGTHG